MVYCTTNYENALIIQNYYYGLSQDISSDSETFLDKFKDAMFLKDDSREFSNEITYGYCNRGIDSKGVLMGNQSELEFSPTVYLKDQQNNKIDKYRMLSLYFRRFLIVILRKGENHVEKRNFVDLRINLKKLLKNASEGFEEQYSAYVKFHERYKKIN